MSLHRLAGFATALVLCAGLGGAAWAVDTGDRAIDFSLPTIDGKTIKLSELRGKVVLIDFWATWCEPCKKELPLLQKLNQKLKAKGFVMLAININKKKDDAVRFATASGLTMTILFDPSSSLPPKYKLPKMPSSFLIDKKGIVKKVNAGFYDSDEMKTLETAINDLLVKK